MSGWMIAGVIAAWLTIWAFNVYAWSEHWLNLFGKVELADLVFCILLSAFGPFAMPMPLAWFIAARTKRRVNWSRVIWRKA